MIYRPFKTNTPQNISRSDFDTSFTPLLSLKKNYQQIYSTFIYLGKKLFESLIYPEIQRYIASVCNTYYV